MVVSTPSFYSTNAQNPFSVVIMTKIQPQIALQEDLHVDLTFHDFSVSLLNDFAEHIVKPYFKGNTTRAIQKLMEKALAEEQIVHQVIER